mmetsp:Transcript_10494/g.24905  ORF Transcript_10494/g.24905 Transcript_10494/m.24905 type:complete len:471 (-) Transcript_10494:538-1950(-)
MVEGPGATRNGHKVQPVVGLVLCHLKIQKPLGNSNVNGSSSLTAGTSGIALEGRRLESAFSVGKEVFLLLGPILRPIEKEENRSESDTKRIALRLHFGMNGILTVRKYGESSKIAPWRKNDNSVQKCTMKFARSALFHRTKSNFSMHETCDTVDIETVASTCSVVSAFVAESKLKRLQNKDVCAACTNFESEAVLEAIIEKRYTAMICDAILDQDRFPGVGNIIKIEGLHNAGVHPRRLVETLSREELKRVILACRAYALGWLSTGKAPTKQVYNRVKCGSCRTGRVRMVKMGRDLSRVTFWCEKCQPFCNTPTTNSNPVPPHSADNDSSSHFKCENDHHTQTPPSVSNCCPQHGSKTTILRRVRKTDSSNLHRLFRTCRVRGCPYFCWADSHLPCCGCRHKTVLRVSKTERTGGRWFLSCAAPNSLLSNKRHQETESKSQRSKSCRCAFFQWATPSQLAPFADDLSPLT